MEVMAYRVDAVQETRRSWLDVQERTLLHEVYVTKIDALYNLHAILGHMPYSQIERMILKGLYNGYSFDMSLLKQLVNVKCDICMSAKITEAHWYTAYQYDTMEDVRDGHHWTIHAGVH